MIEQRLVPAPGNVAVVRELVEDVVSTVERVDGTKIGLYRPDDERSHMQRVNPWALVVGVGKPRLTDRGTTIKAPCKLGDKVLIAQVGKYVELTSAGGQREWIYVLPFEGVIAWMSHECSECGKQFRDAPESRRHKHE